MSAHLCRFLVFNINFSVLCHTVAIWLTIALAIFRYICVRYPTHGAALCSLQRAKLAIFAIYLTSAIVCIPNYMVTGDFSHLVTHLVWPHGGPISMRLCGPCRIHKNPILVFLILSSLLLNELMLYLSLIHI